MCYNAVDADALRVETEREVVTLHMLSYSQCRKFLENAEVIASDAEQHALTPDPKSCV